MSTAAKALPVLVSIEIGGFDELQGRSLHQMTALCF